ncbi:hypothetical protein RN001_009145 [Aquatica leii]|uniref:Sodium-dependent multivitamin transporter n=1 Tax=Aquatica leii TaxID=1421715 RepID=A0AAN7P459_9COLE|nr:hypothetical protein RN001_009145 [Aquatica leii]
MLLIEQSNEILPVITSLQGITLGPLLGLFILGALIPPTTAQAALISVIVSFLFVLWIGLGNILSAAHGSLIDFSKPISVEGCTIPVNSTNKNTNTEEAFILYQIAFWYNLAIGAAVTTVLGIILSCFTKKNEKPLNKDYFSPVIHRFLD